MRTTGASSITTGKAVAVPFLDLSRQHLALRDELAEALSRVMAHGRYVLGPEVEAFEEEFAQYVGCRFGIGVGSGTEAIHVALRACGVGPGDEVVTVSHTAVATVAAVELAGARPVLVDVDAATCSLDPTLVERAISPRTRAIVPVHLYGAPAEMSLILDLARRHGLRVVEDCAQAHGATYGGRRLGSLGDMGCFSFYPTKNLGAVGDGGMVTTDNPDLARQARLVRQYGWRERHVSTVKGLNSRLDEIQAAVLRVKLRHLNGWNARRRELAARYLAALHGTDLQAVRVPATAEPVFHLFVVRAHQRDALRTYLLERGVATLVHYPVPVHMQEAYRDLGYGPGSLPATEAAAQTVVSLPLYPEMRDEEADAVATAVAAWGRA